MLESKEFYDVMADFERLAPNFVRVGNEGFNKTEKYMWAKGIYYNDSSANNAFKLFLNGYSYGKSIFK